MILGIGIDIVRVERFLSWLENDRLMEKYFGPEEIEYVRSQGRRAAESLAVRFAAKEALGKSLGCGLEGWNLREVQVHHGEGGAPFFRFQGAAAENLGDPDKNGRYHLSLSHDNLVAVAVVIREIDHVR